MPNRKWMDIYCSYRFTAFCLNVVRAEMCLGLNHVSRTSQLLPAKAIWPHPPCWKHYSPPMWREKERDTETERAKEIGREEERQAEKERDRQRQTDGERARERNRESQGKREQTSCHPKGILYIFVNVLIERWICVQFTQSILKCISDTLVN